jgi:hypothetical protein
MIMRIYKVIIPDTKNMEQGCNLEDSFLLTAYPLLGQRILPLSGIRFTAVSEEHATPYAGCISTRTHRVTTH